MKKEEKTNVMRLLDGAKIPYVPHYYGESGAVAGLEVAETLREDPDRVFKTLVTVGKTGQHYVFVIPVSAELSLRKAAAAVGEKSVEMVKAKELLPLTGYIHGGCSPLGMKKPFPTVFDETAALWERVYFSAGKVGAQVEVALNDLTPLLTPQFADLTE
ncbi:MAG: Cys-tRNA(Pro) deacylase [bacterium]